MPDYDVIVLGGGSAGSSAAAAASEAGARTLMINDGELGGLCILRGCMPTKTLLASAHAVHAANDLERFGVRLEGHTTVDFSQIMQRKTEMVTRFKRAKVEGIESADYELLDARARFAKGGGVEAAGRTLTAKRYVIASGSTPAMLPIPGLEDVPVLTSDDVMRLTSQPESILVQGAGPIGLELAQFFARIGTQVLLVNRSPILSRLDPLCGAELRLALEAEARFELAVPGRIDKLVPRGDGLVATITDGDTLRTWRADALLMATGRRANLENLGLEHVGLDPSDGRLTHDDSMRTTHPEIYVAGDATGRQQILHVANQEGRTAGHNAAVGRPERQVDDRLLIEVLFTDPPYAQIGMTALRADEAGRDVVIGEARFAETGRAIMIGATHGIWRLVADRESGEILGSSILGPRADDLVHLVALMVRYRTRAAEIQELPWYHPTVSEVLLNLSRAIVPQLSAKL